MFLSRSKHAGRRAVWAVVVLSACEQPAASRAGLRPAPDHVDAAAARLPARPADVDAARAALARALAGEPATAAPATAHPFDLAAEVRYAAASLPSPSETDRERALHAVADAVPTAITPRRQP